jgi:hypothetical protein
VKHHDLTKMTHTTIDVNEAEAEAVAVAVAVVAMAAPVDKMMMIKMTNGSDSEVKE